MPLIDQELLQVFTPRDYIKYYNLIWKRYKLVINLLLNRSTSLSRITADWTIFIQDYLKNLRTRDYSGSIVHYGLSENKFYFSISGYSIGLIDLKVEITKKQAINLMVLTRPKLKSVFKVSH